MKKYNYRFTAEELDDGGVPTRSLRIALETHEDIFGIIDKICARNDLPPDEALAFGLGLKLFSEVVRRRRETLPFSAISPHLASIMKIVKKPANRDA